VCRTTGWMEEKEEVTRAERPTKRVRAYDSRTLLRTHRFESGRLILPLLLSRIMGGENFLSQRMRRNDVENRKECPIGPLHRFFSLYSLCPLRLSFYIFIICVAIIISIINYNNKIQMFTFI